MNEISTSSAHDSQQQYKDVPWLTGFPGIVLPHAIIPFQLKSTAHQLVIQQAFAESGFMVVTADHADQRPCQSGPRVDGCLVRVVDWRSSAAAAGMVMMEGLQRVRATAAGEASQLRAVNLQCLNDQEISGAPSEHSHFRWQLLKTLFEKSISLSKQKLIQQLFQENLPLGMLCDIVMHGLPVSDADRWQALQECCVRQRCHLVLESLQKLGADPQSYPPSFSCN